MRYFGTDGVRGIANKELTCEMASCLGKLAVSILGPRLVLGRDSRQSGAMLEAALTAGITAAGGSVWQAGIIPTPAIALLTRELGASGGIVVSASHNPPEHNGIKFFDAQGFKLTKAMEDAFEEGLCAVVAAAEATAKREDLPAAIRRTLDEPLIGSAVGSVWQIGEGVQNVEDVRGAGSVGKAATVVDQAAVVIAPATATVLANNSADTTTPGGEDLPISVAAERYIQHAVNIMTAQNISLEGMTIAVDTGHGASSVTTPETFSRLGAEVVVVNADFDGNSINVGCGSTNLEPLKALVRESGADIGIAHDGDADRVLAVDGNGNEIDGDVIEAICALDLKAQNKLTNNTVVSTVMCNLGFVKAMEAAGIKVIQTAVGDSNVLAAMREGNYVIGGEQSGHMIFLEHNSTGDGLVTALQLLAAVKRSGKQLAEAAQIMQRFPQVLINVHVVSKAGFADSQAIQAAIAAAEERLGNDGRVLVRASGTENLIRVMTEAASEEVAEQEAKQLEEVVAKELG